MRNESLDRSTRCDSAHNDVSGDGSNVAVSGAFKNFPDIPDKSVEIMKK